ncbi:gliding motility protein GldM [Flavihumibacter petaseus]|uniref:Gliding motility-associated protein GldM n=1 Tax=Flavihumibacter petaseus NBRC 106054 TaxID=1220578 RepID=A0A0E9N5Z8_9BACT|nr:gliding motility protein GldM [Flavihumibacter petaseus]GAO45121.1 gliding motility-associated protein GldM [Flavihumibacter petaseus NBRC 106054]
MALPKEPRQKMINMMYLVLTALLALNVSSEILNAFKTVNNSITTANAVVDKKNASIFEAFKEALSDPKTAENANKWFPKAQEAQKLSDDLSNYINDLKTRLKKEAKGENIGTPEEKFSEDNLDAATRMLVEGKDGVELENRLKAFKTNLLNVIPEDQRAAIEKSLPLDLSIPKSQTGSTTSKEWKSAYFHMTPTIAALTILSKFQNDVKNSEAIVVDHFYQQIGKVKFKLDKFEAFASQNSQYLMPGQELVITSGIGAFSTEALPSVTVNGAKVTTNPDGSAIYKTTVNGAGEHTVKVVVAYKDPNTGEDKTTTKDVTYTVGVPSGASVFLEKMNVVYMAVDNPVMVSAGSAGKEKMNVSFTNGTISPAGGDRYIIKPSKMGPGELKVTVDGKTTSFPLRCKNLPDPTATVGNSRGGSMGAAQFKAMGGVLAKLLDSEFEAKYDVLSYVVGANGGAFQVYRQAPNDGARWTGSAAQIISMATPGSSIFFDQIRVKGPDGKVRELPGIFFNLK